MMNYIITWFIIGFIGATLCSLVDYFFNDVTKFSVKPSLLGSFLGPFVVLWFFIYHYQVRKQNEKYEQFRKKNEKYFLR